MAYTVTQLITRAFYLSNILAKGFQTISGDQLNDGLDLLNELLSQKTANQRLIPYFDEYNFTAEVGENKYFIPRAVLIETLTYTIGSVRYSASPIGRIEFQGSARPINITSLTFEYHFERTLGGGNIFVYFPQNSDYPMKVWGKFSLQNVTFNEDLSLKYDLYYIAYLRYALAEYLCQEYGATFLPDNKMKLDEIENILVDISPLDMSVNKSSLFRDNCNGNDVYAIANLSNGWI